LSNNHNPLAQNWFVGFSVTNAKKKKKQKNKRNCFRSVVGVSRNLVVFAFAKGSRSFSRN
jgi:hypothetical protein